MPCNVRFGNGIYKPHICSSQTRGSSAPYYKPKGTEQLHTLSTLQDGDNEGFDSRRRLANQSRFKKCLPYDPCTSSTPKVFEIPVAGQFKVVPLGLSSVPYIFTKLLKPVVALLRKMVIRLVLYLDKMLLMAKSQTLATTHFHTAVLLMKSLGFIVNTDKCVPSPTQQIKFLGFSINSHTMTPSLPMMKLTSLVNSARHMRDQKEVTVRELSQMLGAMVVAHPAILPAPRTTDK